MLQYNVPCVVVEEGHYNKDVTWWKTTDIAILFLSKNNSIACGINHWTILLIYSLSLVFPNSWRWDGNTTLPFDASISGLV